MLKKYLNKFLNRKSDFIEDENLRSLNEQFYYMLDKERKFLNFLLIKNIKYYLAHKKIYLLQLLFTNRISIFFELVFVILFGLNYFNVLDITKPIKTREYKTAYSPDWDSINQKKLIRDGYEVRIFFEPDPRKDWKLYKQAVHRIETGGMSDSQSYTIQSPNRIYWGKYQLGPEARKIAKAEKYTWKDFSSNPDAQEAAFLEWAKFLKKTMQPEISQYSGRFISGVQMTESGIISIAHNAGYGAAKSYLSSGKIPQEVIKFAKLGDYNLNLP